MLYYLYTVNDNDANKIRKDMTIAMFRHTESIKLDKSDIQLFKKCAKLFKYEYELADAIGVSRQKLWSLRRTWSGNSETIDLVKKFNDQYREQARA